MVISQLVRTPVELLKSPTFLLKRMGMLAKERSQDAYDAGSASAFAHAVLEVLDEGARETQATIADALCYDRSYLVGVLDELEANGFVERKRDPDDRRRHVVSMTSTGKKELVRLRKIHAQLDSDFFAPLTQAERKTLHELLAKLAAAHDPRYST